MDRKSIGKAMFTRKKVLAFTIVGIISAIGIFLWHGDRDQWVYHVTIRYDSLLGPVINDADKIVVRSSGYNCCRSIDADPALFTVTDPKEVQEVVAHLKFEPVETSNSMLESCLCCGGPGIDWYRGRSRIALTALQHGRNLRWNGYTTARYFGFRVGYGDAPLTMESQDWLCDWLEKHGVPEPKREMTHIRDVMEKVDRARQERTERLRID